MFCPSCGHDELRGSACSQCGTILSATEQKTATEQKPARSAPPPLQKPPPTSTTKPQKHRSRPLHDLDLTLPEFDVVDQKPEKPTVEKHKGEKHKEKASPQAPTGVEEPRNIEFSTFIFSLGSNALIAMGEAHMLGTPQQKSSADAVNLPQAKEIIDILGILEEKTKGNLTSQESELLKQTLYTLRTKYVQATKSK